jgi:hypothetical protein
LRPHLVDQLPQRRLDAQLVARTCVQIGNLENSKGQRPMEAIQ